MLLCLLKMITSHTVASTKIVAARFGVILPYWAVISIPQLYITPHTNTVIRNEIHGGCHNNERENLWSASVAHEHSSLVEHARSARELSNILQRTTYLYKVCLFILIRV